MEHFDDSQLSDDESDGGIIEDNMREDPTTWQDWLVFDDDLVTDASGRVSHKDTRFYDFSHAYCNGHPIPPESEIDESEGREEGEGSDEVDEAAEEYERLMEEWQAAVNECEARAAAGGGTFHHWECGREEEPSEEESFEASGCKEARDNAYKIFINLEYDYTFKEAKPRDGYIIHNPGHPMMFRLKLSQRQLPKLENLKSGKVPVMQISELVDMFATWQRAVQVKSMLLQD